MARTLITGVTGFLGRHLLWRRLRKAKGRDRVLCLIRATTDDEAAQRLARVLDDPQSNLTAAQKKRAVAVCGDLSTPKLGVSEAQYRQIAKGLTDVLHCAASVKFTLNLEHARQINVEGTRRLLDLARLAKEGGSLKRFDYVGTSYVAGKRKGLVKETELDVSGRNFNNTYEQTKAESENLVRSAAAELPVTIFRPSVVVGDSKTGITQSFNVMYWPLKVFARGWVLVIPADAEALVDIVPIDFVTDAIEYIAEHETPSGECFHIAAGPKKSVTIGHLVEKAAQTFGMKRIPPYVSPVTFNTVLKPIFKLVLFGPYKRTYNVGQQYLPYLAYRAIFDVTNTERALEGSGISCRSVSGYFHLLLNFCVATDWGKNRVSAQELEAMAEGA